MTPNDKYTVPLTESDENMLIFMYNVRLGAKMTSGGLKYNILSDHWFQFKTMHLNPNRIFTNACGLLVFLL